MNKIVFSIGNIIVIQKDYFGNQFEIRSPDGAETYTSESHAKMRAAWLHNHG